MRVLVIHPEAGCALCIRRALERHRFAVDVSSDGRTGLERLLGCAYEIAVVNEAVTNPDGFSIVRTARAEEIETLILMVTERSSITERLRALHAGADDVLSAPFAEDEFVARLNALARRAVRRSSRVTISLGALLIDVSAHVATFADTRLGLSATEFRLLAYLVRNAGITSSRVRLLAHVWNGQFDGPTNVVDVCIGALRRKLDRAGCPGLIKTVHGIGYRIDAHAALPIAERLARLDDPAFSESSA
jgi:DNA-binding response OmpR family regulator